jgi:hypothetical protein
LHETTWWWWTSQRLCTHSWEEEEKA